MMCLILVAPVSDIVILNFFENYFLHRFADSKHEEYLKSVWNTKVVSHLIPRYRLYHASAKPCFSRPKHYALCCYTMIYPEIVSYRPVAKNHNVSRWPFS